jgi:hypothetical protein
LLPLLLLLLLLLLYIPQAAQTSSSILHLASVAGRLPQHTQRVKDAAEARVALSVSLQSALLQAVKKLPHI